MKKLFAIAVAVGMLSGLYGASIGLGVQYTINEPRGFMDTVDISYPSVLIDLEVPIIPVLGLRCGLVEYNIIGEDDGGNNYKFGTGVYGDIVIWIPTQMMFKPYIPIGFIYGGSDAGSELHLKGGVGGMVGFGGVNGFLEGGVKLLTISPEAIDSESNTFFFVQGGIRVPFGM